LKISNHVTFCHFLSRSGAFCHPVFDNREIRKETI
jgi:hypothetical protein